MSENVRDGLAWFTRRMSVLQDAGLPVLRSIRVILSDREDGALYDALNGVAEDIECGHTLSECFSKRPQIFDPVYVNMVKAGEAGGALELIFQRLADWFDKPNHNELAGSLRVLGMLIGSGVPILEALSLVRKTCLTDKYRAMYKNAYDAKREGKSLAEPLKKAGILPAVVVDIIDIGEKTCYLGTMLYKAADFLESEAQREQRD